jgi:hypothetical protein
MGRIVGEGVLGYDMFAAAAEDTALSKIAAARADQVLVIIDSL